MVKLNFETQRLPGKPFTGKLDGARTIEVYATNDEQVLVYVARCGELYAFGYKVYVNGGRSFDVAPNPEFGLFRTAAFAEGYALQLIFEKAYISDEARNAVLQKALPLRQLELF